MYVCMYVCINKYSNSDKQVLSIVIIVINSGNSDKHIVINKWAYIRGAYIRGAYIVLPKGPTIRANNLLLN